MFKSLRQFKSSKRGFTLVEMLISLMIFSIVAIIAAGAYLRMIDANRKAQALKTVNNNLHYALEEMAREIRMGTVYHCAIAGDSANLSPSSFTTRNDCSNTDGILFAFENPDGNPASNADQYAYRLNGTQIEKTTDSGSTWFPVTAPDVKVTKLAFRVFNSGAAFNGSGAVVDINPAYLRILIKGYVLPGNKQSLRTDFQLQTTLSERIRE